MELNRVHYILDNKEKCDVFYEERPVWIQGVNDNIAKVGFVDNFEERDVFIEDLYERNLYN
ncbi:MAG: small, acid-soluble spore protein, H family [Clostridia bacterium]|nr:small, acid-soluble spore protein, H family [Clostridia bacterium]